MCIDLKSPNSKKVGFMESDWSVQGACMEHAWGMQLVYTDNVFGMDVLITLFKL